MNGSILRASFGDTHLVTSKSRTSPAMRVVKPVVSKWVIGPMPERPLTMPSQLLARSLPSGETRPRPVTTTRLLKEAGRLDMEGSACERDRIVDRTAPEDERRTLRVVKDAGPPDAAPVHDLVTAGRPGKIRA